MIMFGEERERFDERETLTRTFATSQVAGTGIGAFAGAVVAAWKNNPKQGTSSCF